MVRGGGAARPVRHPAPVVLPRPGTTAALARKSPAPNTNPKLRHAWRSCFIQIGHVSQPSFFRTMNFLVYRFLNLKKLKAKRKDVGIFLLLVCFT